MGDAANKLIYGMTNAERIEQYRRQEKVLPNFGRALLEAAEKEKEREKQREGTNTA